MTNTGPSAVAPDAKGSSELRDPRFEIRQISLKFSSPEEAAQPFDQPKGTVDNPGTTLASGATALGSVMKPASKSSILLTIPALFVSYAARNLSKHPAFQNLGRTVQRPFNQESTDLMNNKLKPAIIGGVVLGILSVIPFVNWVNFCCCLWAILGGLLASHLYVKSSPTPTSTGDGAIVGALAGLVGGVIVIIIGIPISILASGFMTGILVGFVEGVNPAQAEMMRAQMEAQSIAGHIVNGFILAVLLIVFSTLGGLIGISIFEKRKGTPPPPQNFGGGPGGPSGPGGYGVGA